MRLGEKVTHLKYLIKLKDSHTPKKTQTIFVWVFFMYSNNSSWDIYLICIGISASNISASSGLKINVPPINVNSPLRYFL